MAEHRYYLVSQHDWGKRTGFYLAFENRSPSEPCQIQNLALFFGVADGEQWYVSSIPAGQWQINTRYQLRAEITSERASLWLNGKQVGEQAVRLSPAVGKMNIGEVPSWAFGDTDYHLVLTELRLLQGGREQRFKIGGPPADLPEPLRFFNPHVFWGLHSQFFTHQVDFAPTLPLAIEVIIQLARIPDWRRYIPYVDRYGQCRYANYPTKVRRDADLRRDYEQEQRILQQWGVPNVFDPYGGYLRAGWRERPTGFYRIVRRDGYWWLVSPEGYPCFYTGVCSAPMEVWELTPVSDREEIFEWLPPREGEYAGIWTTNAWGEKEGTEYVSLYAVNLMRRLGANWRQTCRELAKRRLRTWGFSGVGKWGYLEDMPFASVLSRGNVPNLVSHPDIFDSSVQSRFRAELVRQITPYRRSPWVLGWSVGNEDQEIIRRDEIRKILELPYAPPAKVAIVEHLLRTRYDGNLSRLAQTWGVPAGNLETLCRASITKASEEELEAMRRFYADRYYAWIYQTVKEIDPDHLYFGFWIYPYGWENDEDWNLIAKHCDVLGYDYYSLTFSPPHLARLFDRIDKPILCGEFAFATYHKGLRGWGAFMGSSADDDREAGELYVQWITDAAQHPLCVGAMWFQYRDQPITGRGPGRGKRLFFGEHVAHGIIEFTDRPKWDLVKRMREVNLKAAAIRLQARKT
jgi:hypothetical protein